MTFLNYGYMANPWTESFDPDDLPSYCYRERYAPVPADDGYDYPDTCAMVRYRMELQAKKEGRRLTVEEELLLARAEHDEEAIGEAEAALRRRKVAADAKRLDAARKARKLEEQRQAIVNRRDEERRAEKERQDRERQALLLSLGRGLWHTQKEMDSQLTELEKNPPATLQKNSPEHSFSRQLPVSGSESPELRTA